jgi:L-2-hydroxyglutarate oxidase LhgO
MPGDDLDFDATIVGAGVVGLACAAELAEAGASVLLVERHEGFGRETSGRNSEVVHAGFYYEPGSLKARACVAGRRAIEAAARAGAVPLRRTGKLLLALSEEDEPRLEALLERGRANGVEGLELVGRRRVAELEPGVSARAALWSPASAVTSAHALGRWLLGRAESAAAAVAWATEVTVLERSGEGWSVETRARDGTASRHESALVVNAAGLHADAVLERAGLDPDALGLRQHWSKGCWFSVAPSSRARVTRLVYPPPPRDGSGLGIHATVDLGGRLKLGPDAEPAPRERAALDVPESKAEAFFAACEPWLSGLRREDLAPDQAGLRARLAPAGQAGRDFVVRDDEGLISLLGVESPGLTAAPALAVEVRRLARERGLPA